jgi:hypothetical protein
MQRFVVDEKAFTRMAELGMTRAQVAYIFGCSYPTLTEQLPEKARDIFVANGSRARKRYRRCHCCPHQPTGAPRGE